MNEISLYLSTFGASGLFIWYLLNKEKTDMKNLTQSVSNLAIIVKDLSEVITTIERKRDSTTSESLDDLGILMNEFLDYVMPSHKSRRQTKDLRSRIDQRRVERESQNALEKINN